MIQNARDWLPIETLQTPAVRAAFEAAVSGWSARWFGGRPVSIADMRARSPKPSVAGAKTRWHCFAPGVFLDWGEHVQASLAHHGLHAAPSNASASTADSSLLNAFAERIVDDLVEALGKVIGTKPSGVAKPGHPYQEDGGVEFRVVSSEGAFSITVGISAPAMVSLRKGLCPAFKPATVEPFELMEALGAVHVPFKASLGKARMTARELSHLALEDIVILDTAHDAPIILRAEGSNRVLCATELGREREELILKTIEFEGVAA